ncbi:hypothetical protein N752_20410 [Desulforamulus aquiferis]|nr:hypothetical protein N752_20410 [Desulforamulus aquiferis]
MAKAVSMVDLALLEHCIREDLNIRAPRVMAVLNPLKVIIENYPEGQVEELEAEYNSENPELGSRKIPFSRIVYIEQDDFMEEPPKKFFRLYPGSEVRLKHAYIIKCERVVKDEQGRIVEIYCTYDPDTKSGSGTSTKKVKGTLHWVSAEHAVKAEVRLYDRLFTKENPDEGADFKTFLNPDSLKLLGNCMVEPSLAKAAPGSRFQFLRHGYFSIDAKDSNENKLVFNRIVSLKDSWAKLQKNGK